MALEFVEKTAYFGFVHTTSLYELLSVQVSDSEPSLLSSYIKAVSYR